MQDTVRKVSLMGNFGKSYGQTRDEEHIFDALLELGVEAFKNDIPDGTDLILAFKSRQFGAEDVVQWRKKAPVWIWTFDNMDRYPWFYDIARECDVWLGEQLGRREWFRQKRLPFYYFPYHAVPPSVFHKVSARQVYDVVFTGTPYEANYQPDKFELLRAIQDKFNLHIFGNNPDGWHNKGLKNVHGPRFDGKLGEIVGKARINLAISNVQTEGYWSIRTSQILMCGGFALGRFVPQMEKELKDNVVYFEDIDDCLKTIEYYLKNPVRREDVAKKGHEYALKYLSVSQRIKELLILFENRNSIVV